MKTLLKLAAHRHNLPIFNCVLFTGNTARATDLEVTATITGDWFFPEPTLITVATLKAALLLSKTPDWKALPAAPGFNAADFPLNLAADANFTPVEFTGDLSAMLARVLPAMAKEDICYYLNGLFLTDNVLVAADGHRMHIENAAHKGVTGETIIPRAVFDLVKPTGIALAEGYARIEHKGGLLYSKLIDGKFPDYKRHVPARKERPTSLPVNGAQRETLKKLVAINKINKEKFGGVLLQQNGMAYVNSGTELQFTDCTLPDEFRVNAAYLLDAVTACGAGEMRLAGQYDSALFTSGNFTAVVMPMRI